MAVTRKGETPKKAMKFRADTGEDRPVNLGSMTDSLSANLQRNERLSKNVRAQTVKKELKGKYDRSKVVFSSRAYSQTVDNVNVKGWRRVQDPEQRELAQIDPYISAIIATRSSQAAACGYPSDNKFDKGVRCLDLQPPSRDDFQTDELYERECEIHEAQMKAIMNWVLNCGTTDEGVINYAFAGEDLTFKHCTFREFMESQIRNILTFGRCATQIFRNSDLMPVMFRPAPVETIMNVIDGRPVFIGASYDTSTQSNEDVKDYNEIDPEERPFAYVQRIDGQNVNFFTEDDMHVWHWQKQALFDLNGYMLSPIEQAIYMVYVHQQTLAYLRNQFIKGMATKGIITIESTNPAVDISDADLEDFRQQFHNFVTRNDNSAVTPVIAGQLKVGYVPLSQSPKDMEFLQVEEHVIRALCSAFQISPQEMGYGHLSLPQGGLTQSNKQEDIIKGEERGLRMLLDVVFDGLNRIIWANFPDAQDKYRLTYNGVGEDTRDAVIQRQQAEINTTATLNSLYADSDKTEVIPFGGDAPLSPAWNSAVVGKMKYGEYREYFLKDEGAAKKPEYDFIIDPNLNEAYQQLKVQPVDMQRAGAMLQLEGTKQQIEAGDAQMDAGGQPQGGEPGQEGAPQEGQPQDGGGEAAPEKAEKSEDMVTLRQKWHENQKLKKSVVSYFESWIDVHDKSKLN